jgi:hypothetical protein
LDFENTRATIVRLVADISAGLSGGAGKVLDALTNGAPTVTETHTDSKLALEKMLRAACEDFIQCATKSLAGPLLSFVAKLSSLDDGEEPRADLDTDSFVHHRWVTAGPGPLARPLRRLSLA